MQIGYVTDMHIGMGVQGDQFELLERIADAFAERGVDTVVLLGDIATVKSPDRARDLLGEVRQVFAEFECYATAGNGDNVEVLAEIFEDGPNAIVSQTDQEATVLVNSATTAEHHVGRIDPHGLELVEDQLAAGKSVTVATHFPLQRTEHLTRVFATQPEYAYPDNKGHLKAVVQGIDGELSRVVCGHLHPDARLRVVGEPLGVKLDVLEPVTRIDVVYDEDVVRSVNERIVIEDLIYEA